MKIYTKTGDKGQTSLIGGRRVSKADCQVEAYGELDELNSWMGFLVSEWVSPDRDVAGVLVGIQACIFKIGGFYSFDFQCGKPFSLPFLREADLETVEKEIDRLEAVLPPLECFVLPGGDTLACHVHIARTVCRRCERALLRFDGVPQSESEREALARSYVNRLADFLFVLARYANHLAGIVETEYR